MADRPTSPGVERPGPVDWLPRVVVFYSVLGAIGLAWMGWRGDPVGERLIGYRVPVPVGAVVGLLVGFLVGPISRRLLDGLRWVGVLESEIRGMFSPLTGCRVLAIAIASAAGEELLFRGGLQPAIGYWPCALTFGLLHGGLSRDLMGWAVFAILAGLGLGALAEWTGGLLAPFLAHAAVNGAALWRLANDPDGSSESRSIDGGPGF